MNIFIFIGLFWLVVSAVNYRDEVLKLEINDRPKFVTFDRMSMPLFLLFVGAVLRIIEMSVK